MVSFCTFQAEMCCFKCCLTVIMADKVCCLFIEHCVHVSVSASHFKAVFLFVSSLMLQKKVNLIRNKWHLYCKIFDYKYLSVSPSYAPVCVRSVVFFLKHGIWKLYDNDLDVISQLCWVVFVTLFSWLARYTEQLLRWFWPSCWFTYF